MNLGEKIKEIMEYDALQHKEGFNSLLKPTFVSANNEQNSFIIQYELQPWQLNPRGELHGGIVSALFDLGMGYGAVAMSGGFSVATADLTIGFLDRVDGADKILVEVTIQKAGKLLIRMRADATSLQTGKIVATAVGTFVPLRKS